MSVETPRDKPLFMTDRRLTPLLVLIAVLVAFDVAIATVVEARGDEAGGIVLGVIFSQIVLIAVWTALGPFSVFARMAGGVILSTLLGLALVACTRHSGVGAAQWFWFLIVTSQWLVIQIPFWVLRLCFGWRLAHGREEIAQSDQSEMQFGIRQLLAWTALVAITLGIGRWLLPEDLTGGRDAKEMTAIFCVLTSFNCLLAWPVVWASLARRRVPLWLIAAAFCCVALTVAEIATFESAMGPRGDNEFVWIMNSIEVLAASVALLIARATGFRLVRFSN
jgi:hypothetical protein